MTEIVAGLLMMGGGGLMVGAAIPLARARTGRAHEVAAALPFTPLPPPDAELDALVASIH